MTEVPAEPVGRPMKYPYTFTAKLAQFPLKFHIKNQWIWRYYFIALGCCVPIFYKIDRLGEFLTVTFTPRRLIKSIFLLLANSPGNVAKWAEMKRKELEGHH